MERSGPHKGFPLSWQHFVYGLQHYNRALHREKLRLSDVVGTSVWAKPEAFQRWVSRERQRAGI